jgi:hypothetical protein
MCSPQPLHSENRMPNDKVMTLEEVRDLITHQGLVSHSTLCRQKAAADALDAHLTQNNAMVARLRELSDDFIPLNESQGMQALDEMRAELKDILNAQTAEPVRTVDIEAVREVARWHRDHTTSLCSSEFYNPDSALQRREVAKHKKMADKLTAAVSAECTKKVQAVDVGAIIRVRNTLKEAAAMWSKQTSLKPIQLALDMAEELTAAMKESGNAS